MSKNPILLTAAEAGLPETEQTKIALELILSQGGVAGIQQIYKAVEKRLPKGYLLSQQGKHSLRRVVNSRAVQQGYIHPYDKSNPGWHITDKGISYIRNELSKQIGDLKFTARVMINFNFAIKEVRDLLTYVSLLQDSNNNVNTEVIRRSSVVLTVTAWESFIEDILGLHVNHKLDNAKSPADFSSAFNTVADNWYKAIYTHQENRPNQNDFVKWTGDNWKELIREKLHDDLDSLNTPKSKNIRDLSKRYLSRYSEFLSHLMRIGLSLSSKETEAHGTFQTNNRCLHTSSRNCTKQYKRSTSQTCPSLALAA
jgi:hypothetical protein